MPGKIKEGGLQESRGDGGNHLIPNLPLADKKESTCDGGAKRRTYPRRGRPASKNNHPTWGEELFVWEIPLKGLDVKLRAKKTSVKKNPQGGGRAGENGHTCKGETPTPRKPAKLAKRSLWEG